MDHYNDELVTRCAPRWAWDVIDHALNRARQGFPASGCGAVGLALDAMIQACEGALD